MNALAIVDGYDEEVVKVCPNGTLGDVIELGGLLIGLPEKPKERIQGEGLASDLQVWSRVSMPQELSRIRSMDEWAESPKEFVTVIGFTTRVSLRMLPEGTTCYSSGLRLILGTRHISHFKGISFFTWLRAKLTHVVLGSFTLSVVALVTLISALLFCLTKLRR